MYIESRKIHLIEEVLKVTNEVTIMKLEAVLKYSADKIPARKKKFSIYDFVGILSKKESTKMRKAIEETCETINPDDWK
ncbi:MAG TPA: hypothetical protein VN451_06175 [Chitinophagaceae bacterium]|nr:hypothetical protein [Chitinophagaceae bacterium]